MTSPLVSRPPYGEGKERTLAVAELPKGDPAGKGISLDPSIPGESTFNKPVDDIREDSPKDESMYRVEEPGDLGKKQERGDQIDHSEEHPGFNGLGKPDPPNKTEYPYRDGVPNAHNASFLAELWKVEYGVTKVLIASEPIRVATTTEQVLNGLDPVFQQRSLSCSATLKRADIPRLRWIFAVDCGNGPKAVKVRAIRKAKVVQFAKLDLELSCSCPAWQWLGPEFHAKSEQYMLEPQVGTASTPNVRDPERDNRVCKHVAAVLSTTRGWEIPRARAQKAVKKAMQLRKAVRKALCKQGT